MRGPEPDDDLMEEEPLGPSDEEIARLRAKFGWEPGDVTIRPPADDEVSDDGE